MGDYNSTMFRTSVLYLAAAAAASATLVRIEVTERSDVLDGKPFGAAGPYERIIGKAHFAVDPQLPANRIIADIGNAPPNENGMVEFSSDLYLLKPRDPAKGNGSVLYEVSNRGRKGLLQMFNRAGGGLDPRSAQHFGDGFLLEQGYTFFWLGWQFDVPADPQLLRLYPAVAKGISGIVRSEFVPNAQTTQMSLADRNHAPYPVSNPDDPKLALTVRDRADGPRRTLPRSAWRIEGAHVAMAAGFEPGKVYEVVYTSQDPPLVGLGPAAIRDMVSHLKYGAPGVFPLGDQRRFIKRAYGFGVSQSGRFLRTFLYYGFNADEKARKVFDGVMAHVAGAGRGSFNHRFAQASRDGHPFFNTFYPTDIFPYTDLPQEDPETGLKGGILAKAMEDGVAPKIFYTNSSYEYWGRAASLIHTTVDGKDAPLAPDTRIYLFAGSQHGPAGFPPSKSHTPNLANPNDFKWAMRALLVAMDRWVKGGVEPPASQFPRISEDKLVAVGALQFPKLPGVKVPALIQKGYRVDYGPEFRAKGIVAIDPPKIVGKPYPIFVPQVDGSGNETAGVRLPNIQVPLASYTGWNLRTPDIGAPDELNSMIGSFIPFARTKEERAQKGDPRPSVAERYASRDEYLKQYEAAARDLARSGYLLEGDIPGIVEQGAQIWDYIQR
jgi:hypothetical protein